MSKINKNAFSIAVEVKLHCLAIMCTNNIQNTCNLKGVAIDERGVCAGMVKYSPIDKKSNTKDDIEDNS